MPLCDAFFTEHVIFSSFTQVKTSMSTSLLFVLNNITLYRNTFCLSVHQLMGIWVVHLLAIVSCTAINNRV